MSVHQTQLGHMTQIFCQDNLLLQERTVEAQRRAPHGCDFMADALGRDPSATDVYFKFAGDVGAIRWRSSSQSGPGRMTHCCTMFGIALPQAARR